MPTNISQETVEVHRAEVAKCALQKEGWFSEHGEYKYEKAENEIKKKQLNPTVEQQMLTQHQQCKQEAESKFGKLEEVIAQIQLYQACKYRIIIGMTTVLQQQFQIIKYTLYNNNIN